MTRRNQGWLVFALVLSLAVTVVGRALTQAPLSEPLDEGSASPARAPSPPVGHTPPPALDVVPFPAPTIDQLLDRLDKVRSQKAELERQEKALIETVRSAVAKQKERLVKSGVEAAPPPAPKPPELIPPTGVLAPIPN